MIRIQLNIGKPNSLNRNKTKLILFRRIFLFPIFLFFTLNIIAESTVFEYKSECDSEKATSSPQIPPVKITTGDSLILVEPSQNRKIYIDNEAMYIPAIKDKGVMSRIYLDKIKSLDRIPLYPVILNLNKKLKDKVLGNGKNNGKYIELEEYEIKIPVGMMFKNIGRAPNKKKWKIFSNAGYIDKIEEYIEDSKEADKDILIKTVSIEKSENDYPDNIKTVFSNTQTTRYGTDEEYKLCKTGKTDNKIELPQGLLIFDQILLDEKDYLNHLKIKKSVDDLYNLGRLYHRQKKMNEATEHLEDAWKMKKFNNYIMRELLQVYIGSGQFDKAKDFITKNETSEHVTPEFFRSAGFIYGIKKDREKEVYYYKKAVDTAKDPKDKIEQLLALGRIYRSRRDLDKVKSVSEEIKSLTDDEKILNRVKNELEMAEGEVKKIKTRRQMKLEKGYEKIIESLKKKGDNKTAKKFEEKLTK